MIPFVRTGDGGSGPPRPHLATATPAGTEALRLALYWGWCYLTWRAAVNVRRSLWTPLARAALAVGLVTVVLT